MLVMGMRLESSQRPVAQLLPVTRMRLRRRRSRHRSPQERLRGGQDLQGRQPMTGGSLPHTSSF